MTMTNYAKQAIEVVKERNEAALQNLVKLQGREIKMLEGERSSIGQAKRAGYVGVQ